MMKITGLSHLFKWENLHNWWLTKYFFAQLYLVWLLKRIWYIYIYAFSRRFYPKRLTVHSGYTFIQMTILSVCVFLGNRTHNLCAANAMLLTTEPQEHKYLNLSILTILYSNRFWYILCRLGGHVKFWPCK